MKLQIISDVHMEFYKGNIGKVRRIIDDFPVLGDVLMLAGDITTLTSELFAIHTLESFAKRWTKVFYVQGNHEYYTGDVNKCLETLKEVEKALPEIGFLKSHKVLEYQGHRFIGDTMWFPNDPDDWRYKRQLNDFRTIKNFDPWCYEENFKFKTFAKEEIKEGDIVMTHHLPSYLAVNPMYKGDALNMFYVSEMFDIIADNKPKVWIHGHSHCFNDMMIENTRVMACPRGYPHEVNRFFKDGLTVDV